MSSLKQVQKYVRASMIVYDEGALRADKVKAHIPDYVIDESLSNKNTLVLVDNQNKELLIAFRGTLLTADSKYKDIGSDILITLGLLIFSTRISNALKVVKNASKKYRGYNIEVTGHSLGAAIGYKVARKNKIEAYLFNCPDRTKLRISRIFSGSNNNIHIYTISTDPIGMLGYKGLSADHTLLNVKTSNPHGLSNFLV